MGTDIDCIEKATEIEMPGWMWTVSFRSKETILELIKGEFLPSLHVFFSVAVYSFYDNTFVSSIFICGSVSILVLFLGKGLSCDIHSRAIKHYLHILS